MTSADPELIARENWIDTDDGLVDRRIFSDQGIYQTELKNIFARGWHFMCHESQIPETGRYFTNFIGEDRVIIVRDQQMAVQVHLNSCPHRGNTICRPEQGQTRSFFCSYHGWNFALDGTLIAVPGEQDFYKDDMNKEQWGLAKAAQVGIYKGFVFATLDPEAIPLTTFLGWVGRLSLDFIAEQGDMQVVDGVQKNRIQCNWKLAVDNLFDWYHPKVSHGSAFRAGIMDEKALNPMKQMVILGEYGHAISGPGISVEEQQRMVEKYQGTDDQDRRQNPISPTSWRGTQSAIDELGPIGIRSKGHPGIFPNLWVSTGGTQLCLRIPKGPLETELWWFTFVEKSMSASTKRRIIQNAIHFFGPGGLLEQDDGENWSHSTRASQGHVTGTRPLNFRMGIGQDAVNVDPGGQKNIETVVNEHAQRWMYQAWQEWMQADSWADLIGSHSAEPEGRI